MKVTDTRAFIRYRDGKLIVNGKVKEVVATPGTPGNRNDSSNTMHLV